MSGEGIFLKVGSDLVVLEEQAYDSEAVLQAALAQHPQVMAGLTTAGSGNAGGAAGAARDGRAQRRGRRLLVELGSPVRRRRRGARAGRGQAVQRSASQV